MSEPLPDYLADGATFLTEDIAIKPYAEDGGPGGYLFMHRHTDVAPELQATPGWCVGRFDFRLWTLAQREPLTVTPSILCVDHGAHGFITDGKWVSA